MKYKTGYFDKTGFLHNMNSVFLEDLPNLEKVYIFNAKEYEEMARALNDDERARRYAVMSKVEYRKERKKAIKRDAKELAITFVFGIAMFAFVALITHALIGICK